MNVNYLNAYNLKLLIIMDHVLTNHDTTINIYPQSKEETSQEEKHQEERHLRQTHVYAKLLSLLRLKEILRKKLDRF